jgi:hypothetical protein
MMTFTGAKASIWLVRLKSSSASDENFSEVAWNGLEAVKLWERNCRSAEGVGDLRAEIATSISAKVTKLWASDEFRANFAAKRHFYWHGEGNEERRKALLTEEALKERRGNMAAG